MKYLLSILVLFSGLSFSTSYLICDEPYTFYPDKEKRKLIQIKDSSLLFSYIGRTNPTGFIITDLRTIKFDEEDFYETTNSFFWNKGQTGLVFYYWWIDRETLVIHNTYDPEDEKDSEKPKCKVVFNSEFSEAKKELQKIANELTDKSRKEHQKELDKRKI